jgi:preprotein translocase subunit YajC
MNLLNILLQAGAKGGGGMQTIIMMVLIFVVFYFFMIRPQQKRQKEIKKFQEALEVGKEVVTAGGIYGKIKEVKDRFVIVEISENVRVKLDKSSVYATVTDTQQPAK